MSGVPTNDSSVFPLEARLRPPELAGTLPATIAPLPRSLKPVTRTRLTSTICSARRNFSLFVSSCITEAAVVVVVVYGSESHAFFTAQSAARTAGSTVMVTKMLLFSHWLGRQPHSLFHSKAAVKRKVHVWPQDAGMLPVNAFVER